MLKSAGAGHSQARRAVAGAVLALAVLTAAAERLYITEFEDPPFVAGPDNWVGTDGWIGNNLGLGVHGIDDDQAVGNDQTAFLGFNQPNSTLVVVAQPLNHDPAAEDTASVVIDTALGIEDSTNGFRDSFWLTIYNIAGQLLGAIRFSNDLATFGIWRYDGLNEFDTGLAFIHGELHLLFVEIDFQNNRWTADLDGIPIFADAVFTATSNPRTFGSFSYEWQLTSSLVTEHGDNWMLVADSIVWAIPPGEDPFIIDSVGPDSGGQPQIEFTAEPGFNYKVQYSGDLATWLNDLPDSTFGGISVPTQIKFSDPTPTPPAKRWYRVVRSVVP